MVGEKAFDCDNPYAEIHGVVDTDDPSTLSQLMYNKCTICCVYSIRNWAYAIAKGEDTPKKYINLPPIYLIISNNGYINNYYSSPFNVITKASCIENIGKGIVLDFGHKKFTFYAVDNHNLLDSCSTGFGGELISEYLQDLLSLQYDYRLVCDAEFAGSVVQQKHCQVSRDLKKTLKVR